MADSAIFESVGEEVECAGLIESFMKEFRPSKGTACADPRIKMNRNAKSFG